MALGRPVTLSPNVASKTVSITATAGQTLFEPSGGYRINEIAVYRNGTRLVNGQDFTARDGASVLLVSGATLNDVLEFQIFDSFNIANTIKPNEATQTITGELVVDGGIIGAVLGIQSAGSLVGTARTVNFIGSGNTVVDNGDGTINVSISGETAGIDTSATSEFTNISVSGIATVGSAVTINSTGIDAVSGVITASSFVGNVTGNTSGTAGGLTGTPDITVRNVTGVAATFTGVLTYEDVTNVDSVGIVTARGGLEVGAAGVGATITSAGNAIISGFSTFKNDVTFVGAAANIIFDQSTDDIIFNDNAKAIFGTSSDGIEVYHNGSASYIHDSGTGDLNLCMESGSKIVVQSGTSGSHLAEFNHEGAVELFYNGSQKLHTHNTGIHVTGIATVTSVIYTGSNGSSIAENNLNFASSGKAYIDHRTTSQDIDFRVSHSSALDRTAITIGSAGITTFYDTPHDDIGTLRSIPLQDESGSGGAYTLVASDAGQCVHIHGTTTGVLVNDSTFNPGDAVTIVNGSAGTMAITQGSCTIRYTADSTTGSKTLASFGMCTLWFSGDSVAYLSGAGLS